MIGIIHAQQSHSMASNVSKLQGEVVGESVLQAEVPGWRVGSAQIGINRQDRAGIVVRFRVRRRVASKLIGRDGWKYRNVVVKAPVNLTRLETEDSRFHGARPLNCGYAIVEKSAGGRRVEASGKRAGFRWG